MKWLQNLIVFFGAILIYLHIFIHFKISSFNEFTTISTISKENILSSVYYKLPFVFDGTTIIKPINLKVLKDKKDIEAETDTKDSKESKELNETKLKSDTKKNKKDKGIYKKSYEAFPLL